MANTRHKHMFTVGKSNAYIVLLFDTTYLPGDNAQKIRAVVSSYPVNALFTPPVWYAQHPSGIVVSTAPSTISSVVRAAQKAPDMQIGVTLGAGVSQHHQWSYAELARKCEQLEHLVGCQDCPYQDKMCVTFLTGMGTGNVCPQHNFRNFDGIDEYLREEFARKDEKWQYMSPYSLADDPFTKKKFINVDVHQLHFGNIENRFERAIRGAETRRWRARCKQCAFVHYCPGATGPYSSWRLRMCYEESSASGPFTQQEFDAYLETYPFKLSRDKIEFLVQNSGEATTRLFGGTYRLSRLEAPDSINVIWERVGQSNGPPSLCFSFEDTMRIIKTPYRHRGKYRYPETLDDVTLTNEQLHLYAAVCEKGGVSHARRCGWGTGFLKAHCVSCGYDSSLAVIDARGNRVRLTKYAALSMYDSFPLPDFSHFVHHLRANLKESAGTVDQEPS